MNTNVFRILTLSTTVLLAMPVLSACATAQEPIMADPDPGQVEYEHHFRVFTGDGEPASLADVVAAMDDVDAVLVGEIHTDPTGHWIQARLVEEAIARTGSGRPEGAYRTLALSMEMFERDVQGILDEYLSGLITESHFLSSARPWEYYEEDYRTMVEASREAGVRVLAANAPRRYVNRVTREGAESLNALSPRARGFLPPLPYPGPSDAYREEWRNLMSDMVMESQCPAPEGEEEEEPEPRMPVHEAEDPDPHHEAPPSMPGHGGSFMENGVQAQALWDASMAHTIATFLDQNPGGLVLHMVGGFHVKNFTGIPEKVRFYRPETRALVVHMDLAEDFRTFVPDEHAGRGDFVILTDERLDQSYARNCLDQD